MQDKHLTADERRQFKRFKVKQKSVFVVTSDGPGLGEVVDIGDGGLAFIYAAEKEWPAELAADGCMVFGNNDSCLDLPMKLVVDRLFNSGGEDSEPPVRRRSLTFDNLSREQLVLLECFIWVNSVSEC